MSANENNIVQLGKLNMNCKMMNNKEYSNVMASYLDNGIAYQGSKRYLGEILQGIEVYLNEKQGICEIYDIFSGGGAVTANAAECIKNIYANDLDTTIAIYPVMCSGRTFEALKYLYDFYLIKAEEYVIEHKLNVTAEEYSTFNNTPNELEKEIYTYFFKLVADDSNNGFTRCRECFKSSKKSVDDTDIQLLVAGLSLFISYGSNNNSRKNVHVDKVSAFLKGIKEMLAAWVDFSNNDTDDYTPFLVKYFSIRGKVKGKDKLKSLFATEYAMMHKNITCSQRDALELLEEVEYKAERLIVADPPYPSENGKKYNKDDFKWVDFTYQLLGKLMRIGSPFFLFCDENSIDVFANLVNRNAINMYSFNVRRQNKQALEYVITNIDLPVDYDELPESFKDMTEKAYDIQVCKDMEVRDFDLVKDRYTPLREPKKPIIENTDYNKVLHKVFDEMGMSHLLN